MPKKKHVPQKRSAPKKTAQRKKLPPPRRKKKISKVSVTPPPAPIVVPPPAPVKRRRKAASKMYFTQETEDAIILYNQTEDAEKREIIYREKIEYPLQKLVENVFNRFGFSYFRTGSAEVQREALAHLVSNLCKYDPNRPSKLHKKKKSKAFAYFSVIAKNWFILLNNNTYKEFQTHLPISEERGEDTVQLQTVDKHYAQVEMNEFMKITIDFWESNVTKIFGKQRDLEIAYAVMELLRSAQRIDAFNKKALYLYIRDISDCKTQQITKVINKMKQYHKNIYRMYVNDGAIATSLHLG
jgi:hypothetical protein